MKTVHQGLRRAGVAHCLAAVILLVVGGCEVPFRPTTPSGDVAQFMIAPKSITVQANQDVMFMSVALTDQGDTARVSVTWRASAGSISDTSTKGGRHYGHYKNGNCGVFHVAATSQPGSRSDTATVTVCAVAVASVTVAPATATIGAGQTLQLVATTKDANGNVLSGRAVTWTTSNAAVATVSSSGLVLGVSQGTATITATSEGVSGQAAITVTAPAPVATVQVAPSTASIIAGVSVQLTATTKDAGGNVLSGRAVSWASGNAAVATVSSSGLVLGVSAGSATITATSEGVSGQAAITVTAPPPPPTGSCLTQTGPTLSLSGLQSAFDNTGLADNTKIDASTAQFVSAVADVVALVGGGSAICWHGGEILGQLPPATPWATMHDSYGMTVLGAYYRLENVRIFDTGDGITMDAQNAVSWLWRDVYVKYARDDCIENDFLNSATIENSFFDGCYSGFSARGYTTVLDGSNNVVTVRNSLFRAQFMDQGYAQPGHGGFWKWDPNSPQIDLYNVVFLMDAPTIENDAIMPPPGKLRNCSGNVMIWLGSGPFPEPLPSQPGCFTLMTGSQGRQYWDNAVAQWKAAHPYVLADVGPPIVSIWLPQNGATLTGSVSLTATAVDDRDVAGVQFTLNGQNVGAEVTAEFPSAKFTLTWDSHGLANGVYTLGAIARDAAGHRTTSAGVSVTIAN